MKSPETMEECLMDVAVAWCGEKTEDRQMDVELAKEFAKILHKNIEAKNAEIERLNEAVRDLLERLKDIHAVDEVGASCFGKCLTCELIAKHTPKEQKKVSVERPIEGKGK